MKLRPLNSTVIVCREKEETKSPGGILLPEQAREVPNRGRIEAAPKDCEVKKGDRVLFGNYTGSEIKVDGKSYLVLNVKDLLAVVEE